METDVATMTANPMQSTLLFSREQLHELAAQEEQHPRSEKRKKKACFKFIPPRPHIMKLNPHHVSVFTVLTPTTLKSILRHSQRLDLPFGGQHRKNSPANRRQKNSVKFMLEQKSVDVRKRKGKYLRKLLNLALDLNLCDRSSNRQKARHTKRARLCLSLQNVEESSGSDLEMDDGVSFELATNELKGSKEYQFPMPGIGPAEEIVEKDLFVQRWLGQKKEKAAEGQGFRVVSSSSGSSQSLSSLSNAFRGLTVASQLNQSFGRRQ